MLKFKLRKNKKGVLLILVIVVVTVLTVITSVFFSTLVSERKNSDIEKEVVQSVHLSEAAALMAFAELNKRFPGDLNVRLRMVDADTIEPYVDNNDSLGFLASFGYITGATPFTVADNAATLSIPLHDYLNKGSDWSAVANITVTAVGSPVKDSVDGPFRFYYTYKIDATTSRKAGPAKYERKTVSYSPNSFTIVARHDNFAKFALFTSHHRTPGGTTVWFTADTNFYGPVHTNERFSFANSPSAHFTDAVSQHLNDVRFYNEGHSTLLNGSSNPVCCEREGCLATPCKDRPQFDGGFTTGADIINLPSSISQTELKNQALGTMGNPSSRAVYLPNSGGSLTGGIYIYGNQGQSSDDATVVLSVDASNNAVYTITQRVSSVTHTYVATVNNSANQTTWVVDAGAPTTYNGKPDGVGNEGTLIYSNDNIKQFEGTVERDTKITVSSERDIVISNHVRYQDYTASPLSAAGYNNLLGILSWGGNVRIGSTAPNNIQIHGIVMAHNGIFTVDNYDQGSPRGTATLLGGVITDFYGPFGTFSGGSSQSGYGRNFIYDSRVLEGLAPPYFPYMSSYSSSVVPSDVFSTRTSWRQTEG